MGNERKQNENNKRLRKRILKYKLAVKKPNPHKPRPTIKPTPKRPQIIKIRAKCERRAKSLVFPSGTQKNYIAQAGINGLILFET